MHVIAAVPKAAIAGERAIVLQISETATRAVLALGENKLFVRQVAGGELMAVDDLGLVLRSSILGEGIGKLTLSRLLRACWRVVPPPGPT